MILPDISIVEFFTGLGTVIGSVFVMVARLLWTVAVTLVTELPTILYSLFKGFFLGLGWWAVPFTALLVYAGYRRFGR